jgi:hypothetical protein
MRHRRLSRAKAADAAAALEVGLGGRGCGRDGSGQPRSKPPPRSRRPRDNWRFDQTLAHVRTSAQPRRRFGLAQVWRPPRRVRFGVGGDGRVGWRRWPEAVTASGEEGPGSQGFVESHTRLEVATSFHGDDVMW